jgi:ribosomal protein S19
MAWFDVDVGIEAFAWYDPVKKKIPYSSYIWEDEEKAIKQLAKVSKVFPEMAKLIVVAAIADGKKYVPIEG